MNSIVIIIYIVLIFITSLDSFGQAGTELQSYINQNQADSSTRIYTDNKQIIPCCEVPALMALSHYPELKNIRIVFIEKSIKTTAACRPKWTSLFKRKENRVYHIYINNNPGKIKGAMFNEIPSNAQIGLIGHELGHIVDYSHRGILGIISIGFNYLFIQSRARMERRVDTITIAHHLGWQLYEFDDFVMNCSTVSNAYKDYKRKVYYKPEQLLQLMMK